MRTRFPLILLTALTLMLAGCGDDEDNTDPDMTADVMDTADTGDDTTGDTGDDTSDDTGEDTVDDTSEDGDADAADGDGAECRSNDECTDPADECIGPDAPDVCGVPPVEECDSDMDCPMDTVCHALEDPCSLDGVGSECRAPCTSNQDCTADTECNMDDGTCDPIGCDNGFTCQEHEICDVESIDSEAPIHDQDHGCEIVSCDSDMDCPMDQFCVNGYCQTAVGVCGEPMLVP